MRLAGDPAKPIATTYDTRRKYAVVPALPLRERSKTDQPGDVSARQS